MSYVNQAVKAAVFFAPFAAALEPNPPKYGTGEPNYPVMVAYCAGVAVVAAVMCCFKFCDRSAPSENAQAFMSANNYGATGAPATQTPGPQNV